MTPIRDRIEAETESIERVLSVLLEGGMEKTESLSLLELAGIGALLHDFYNGVENILKQMVREEGVSVPDGPAWHRDLVATAGSLGIISESTANLLKPYLAFRHFFVHGYSLELDPKRVAPLMCEARTTFEVFRKEIEAISPPESHVPELESPT